MKRAVLALARLAAWLWRLVPFAARRFLLRVLLLLESRIGGPEAAMKRLFPISDDLDLIINERATALGGGVHPKHRLTGYHDFFIANIPDGSSVLDLGCGVGEVAISIAQSVANVRVTGIDFDEANLAAARAKTKAKRGIEFLMADITQDLPRRSFDVVVLSNVLEHLDGRVPFLLHVQERVSPARLLIRVPLFERDWRLPMRKELGLSYLSDPTHRIEHSLREFSAEMAEAGLEIEEMRTVWGEIWARLRPRERPSA